MPSFGKTNINKLINKRTIEQKHKIEQTLENPLITKVCNIVRTWTKEVWKPKIPKQKWISKSHSKATKPA